MYLQAAMAVTTALEPGQINEVQYRVAVAFFIGCRTPCGFER